MESYARRFVAANAEYLRTPVGDPIYRGMPFTMAQWTKLNTLPSVLGASQSGLLLGSTTAVNAAGVFMESAGGDADKVGASYNDGSGQRTAFSASTVSVGEWFSTVAVFGSTSSRSVSLNGAPFVEETTATGAISPDVLSLGAAVIAGGVFVPLDGDVAFSAMWSCVLTQSEANAYAAGEHPLNIRPESLLSFWEMDGTSGALIDIVNGHDMNVLPNQGCAPVNGVQGVSPPYSWLLEQDLLGVGLDRNSLPLLGAGS